MAELVDLRPAVDLGALDRVQVLSGSALALPHYEPFDLVFADPPYARGSGTVAVHAINTAGWLAPGGWMAIETARDDAVDPGSLTLEVDRTVGRARLSLLRRP